MRNIKPPLPFAGHKGQWLSELTEIALNIPVGCTVFDVFGGSGCCAEIIKRARPDLTVLWNDFDNYRARLDNADKTERLRRFFLEHLGLPVKKGTTFQPPLTVEQRQFVFDTIDHELASHGFVDIQTLSRWFYLYPQKSVRLAKAQGKMYNRVPVKPYNLDACASWLSGCVRNAVTFTGLDAPFVINGQPASPRNFLSSRNVLFVLDPPYLSTLCDDYRNREALRILESICDLCDRLPFVLFGDLSISFWYERLFSGRNPRKYEKRLNVISMAGKSRSEVMFVCLPGA
jgi:hypothetical protein